MLDQATKRYEIENLMPEKKTTLTLFSIPAYPVRDFSDQLVKNPEFPTPNFAIRLYAEDSIQPVVFVGRIYFEDLYGPWNGPSSHTTNCFWNRLGQQVAAAINDINAEDSEFAGNKLIYIDSTKPLYPGHDRDPQKHRYETVNVTHDITYIVDYTNRAFGLKNGCIPLNDDGGFKLQPISFMGSWNGFTNPSDLFVVQATLVLDDQTYQNYRRLNDTTVDEEFEENEEIHGIVDEETQTNLIQEMYNLPEIVWSAGCTQSPHLSDDGRTFVLNKILAHYEERYQGRLKSLRVHSRLPHAILTTLEIDKTY